MSPPQPTRATVALRRVEALRRFAAAVDELNATLLAAREIWPCAEYYLSEGDTLNLMSGPHHAGNHAKEQPQNVVASASIRGIDSGGW